MVLLDGATGEGGALAACHWQRLSLCKLKFCIIVKSPVEAKALPIQIVSQASLSGVAP